jgi:hypothetical protein
VNVNNIYIAHSDCQVALDFVNAGTGLSAIWALDRKSPEHDPEKPAPDLIRGGARFSEKDHAQKI